MRIFVSILLLTSISSEIYNLDGFNALTYNLFQHKFADDSNLISHIKQEKGQTFVKFTEKCTRKTACLKISENETINSCRHFEFKTEIQDYLKMTFKGQKFFLDKVKQSKLVDRTVHHTALAFQILFGAQSEGKFNTSTFSSLQQDYKGRSMFKWMRLISEYFQGSIFNFNSTQLRHALKMKVDTKIFEMYRFAYKSAINLLGKLIVVSPEKFKELNLSLDKISDEKYWNVLAFVFKYAFEVDKESFFNAVTSFTPLN